MKRKKTKPTVNSQEMIDQKMDSVVGEIIQHLEQGTAPWIRPWASLGPLRNIATGTLYRGRNILTLTSSCYGDPRWITFRDLKTQGGHLKKGSKSSFVVWPVEHSHILNPEAPKEEQDLRTFRTLKYFNVFNIEQVEGISFPEIVPLKDHERIPPIEHLVQSLMKNGLELQHGGDRAFFSPSKNLVRLPELGHFENKEHYYAALFHEICHWSGSESRLNRKLGMKLTPEYAFEELVAELGAAFLCAHYQVDGQLSHSGSYIDSWIQILDENPRETLQEASKLASEAVNFLLEHVSDLELAS